MKAARTPTDFVRGGQEQLRPQLEHSVEGPAELELDFLKSCCYTYHPSDALVS